MDPQANNLNPPSTNLQQTSVGIPNSVVQTPVTQQLLYAGFWERFAAIFLDGLILSTLSFLFNFTVGFVLAISGIGGGSPTYLAVSTLTSTLMWIFQVSYAIYFIGSRGQTIGKMIMKIKVVKSETNEIPGYTTAFLRETVGKFLSGIVFGIGYFVSINDPKKQGWHDKMAKTVVIKITP